ncbi:hypothetical protein J6590_079256 [Homalodisca vitripennis]|nr:hypothetical protein J6590_079256 [Homalodisca vitripennis]
MATDLCTGMSTVSYGRSGVLRWPQCVMAGPVYLTTVDHGRTCVPGWPLWVMAGPVYLRSYANYERFRIASVWSTHVGDGEGCCGRGTPTDPPLATDDSRPQSRPIKL